MSFNLNIIMYHYIRPLNDTLFPKIKGLELNKFRKQLQYIDKNYNVITHQDAIDAVTLRRPLPSNAVWLTFDDGYKDHIDYAVPLMEEFGFYGSFFPTAKPLKESKLLDVNAIHHILASTNSIQNLLNLMKEKMFQHGYNIKDWNYYWDTVDKSSRFDEPEVIFFKRLLQRELPEIVRSKIITNIFEETVKIKESEFVNSLNQRDKTQNMLGTVGVGNTGKSTALNMVKRGMNQREIAVLDCSTFEAQFGLSQILDATFVAINEVETDSKTLTPGLVKQLCDDSIMSAPQKNKGVKLQSMQARIWFLGNEKLFSSDPS